MQLPRFVVIPIRNLVFYRTEYLTTVQRIKSALRSKKSQSSVTLAVEIFQKFGASHFTKAPIVKQLGVQIGLKFCWNKNGFF